MPALQSKDVHDAGGSPSLFSLLSLLKSILFGIGNELFFHKERKRSARIELRMAGTGLFRTADLPGLHCRHQLSS
jgi:hypothetical protein